MTDHIKYALLQFQYEYALRSNVQKVYSNHSDICTDIEHQFTEQITTTMQIPLNRVEDIRELLKDTCNGKITFLT